MKKIVIIAAALLAFIGISALTATSSMASVCQPDGTGCTKAGTYLGPNAVVNNDYSGFKVVWTKSVVQPYSSGVPLYWTAYMTYTNISSSAETLSCPGDWPIPGFVSENMSGGSGDDGTVPAESTTCSKNPDLEVSVPPGDTYTSFATFHNVPWPGSAVAITWGDAGTSPAVYPFDSNSPPPPPPNHPGKACVFNAPKGGIPLSVDGRRISGHVGWAYLAVPGKGIWEYGANEGPISLNPTNFDDSSKTWHAKGTWMDVLRAFRGPYPKSGRSKGYYHSGKFYKTYRCVSVSKDHPSDALSVVKAQSGELYSIPDFDCLSQTVQVLGTYGAPISEHKYLLNPYFWVPNHYYKSRYMSKFAHRKKL